MQDHFDNKSVNPPVFLCTVALALLIDPGIRPALCDCAVPAYAWTAEFPPRFAGSCDIAVDPMGDIILAGVFHCAVDFDPTDGIDLRSPVTSGSNNAFLTKLLPDGAYGWTYSVGGTDYVSALAVDIDHLGEIAVSGVFHGAVDFDQGPAVDLHDYRGQGTGSYNAFITKLTSSGDYLWTRSFDGPDVAAAYAVASAPDGSVVAAGDFGGTVDFDSGEGVELHTSAGFGGMFVTMLTSDGRHVWTRTVNPSSHSNLSAVVPDAAGNIYYAGTFTGIADFDPGPSTDYRVSALIRDNVFVTKLFPDGSYAWTRTYPLHETRGYTVDSEGGIFFAGAFFFEVDFDPTEGIDLHVPFVVGDASGDIFVTKLNGDGSYAWTYTAGGPGLDEAETLAVDSDGGLFVAGNFQRTVDFDPSDGAAERQCDGFFCEFLLHLEPDGSFTWARATPYTEQDSWRSMALDAAGNLYLTRDVLLDGRTDRIDLDPTCGVDEQVPEFPFQAKFLTKLDCSGITADADGNAKVDLWDIAAFQNCFTGSPAEDSGPTTCNPGCDVFDLIPDNALDALDFSALVLLLSGP